MRDKRLVVIADLHCGSGVGLTPEAWNHNDKPGRLNQKNKRTRTLIYEWYKRTMKALAPIDILVVNGDSITGKEKRNDGVELISNELSDQRKMAVTCIEEAKAKTIVMTYGTAYHVSDGGEDHEKEIAVAVNAVKIGSHEWIDVNGKIFDFKHKIGSSSIPHGRHTAPARDALWNMIWAEAELQPKADYVIRSHVHYATASMMVLAGKEKWAITTPALQGMGTRYGARECSGIVNNGVTVFDIDEKGRATWHFEMFAGLELKAQALKL